MKKRILISLSSAVVLVALAIFVIAQTSGTSLRADKSSACSDTEVVMTSSSGCCSSSASTVQAAVAKSSDCTSVAGSAAAAGCSDIIQAAVEAGCPGVTNATKGSDCDSNKAKEDVSVVMVSNTVETTCCEGSATAALLIDECCGSCI